jgi:predicted nucleic acid-binding protein
VLVDTSVWIDHLRKRNAMLVQLLESMQIVTHPFVIGELACGNLANRTGFLDLLSAIPQVSPVTHDETLGFVDAKKLMGRGLGWIDMHLLACAALAKIPLWTMDKRLAVVTRELGLGTTTS